MVKDFTVVTSPLGSCAAMRWGSNPHARTTILRQSIFVDCRISFRVSKTFWTWAILHRIMAPLSKGAANKLLEAIYWRGIHAVEVYEFASGPGKFAHGTANPSTANAVPLPLTREA